MNREINFRVWHKPTATMHHYLKAKFGPTGRNVTLSGKFRDVESPTTLTVANKDLELMQFTGLKDRNGKDICEGDIIADGESLRLPIVWDAGSAGFRCGDGPSRRAITASDEVLGNIYENPELLANSGTDHQFT